ncbi:MAG: sigma-70 family RNA polymerase sigma factor [Ruminococcus sp.]|nr:sigma-70 family RNA polymerase sigma factor [Ruminococcus sp.]
MTDPEWTQLLKKDPEAAYRLLIDTYGNYVYAVVISKIGRCGTREDIEDCVSDVFVDIYKNKENYSSQGGSLKTFIGTIAKRRAIDMFRQLTARKEGPSLDDDTVVLPPSEINIEDEADKRLYRSKLWSTVKSLGEPDSSIIIYQYYYDCTVREIAERLSMTADAVQKRSLRARKKISQLLGKGETRI